MKTVQSRYLVYLSMVLVLCLVIPVYGEVIPVVFRGMISQMEALAGGVSPGDAPGFPVTLSQAGVYEFYDNLQVETTLQHAIEITADGVWLRCDGQHITGMGGPATGNERTMIRAQAGNELAGFGIVVRRAKFVTVEDCVVSDFWDGVLVRNVEQSVFRMNTAQHNLDDGFQIEDSEENVFTQNIVGCAAGVVAPDAVAGCRNGDDGFDVEGSRRNAFVENFVTRNEQNGFAVDDSDANLFLNNVSVLNRSRGFSIDGGAAPNFRTDISIGNRLIGNRAEANGTTANGDSLVGNGIRLRGGADTFISTNMACGTMRATPAFAAVSTDAFTAVNNTFCGVP